MMRSGFDFYGAKTIFASNRLEREAETETEVPLATASGLLGNYLITVIYIEVEARKRILDAFKADREDLLDYMLTFGLG
jgi:hypothetical protein